MYMTVTSGLLWLTAVQTLDAKRQSRLGYCNKFQRDVELTPTEVSKAGRATQLRNLKQ